MSATRERIPLQKPLKAIILATPDTVAAGLVARWLRSGHRVQRIYLSRPGSSKSRISRDRQLASYCPSISLHAQASQAGVKLAYIDDSSSWNSFMQQCRGSRPDVVLSFLFMLRIPARVLLDIKCPILNIHPALLPAYRGASPFTSMVMDGTVEECAGMTLHVVAPDFDTGDIVAQLPVAFAGPRQYGAFLNELIEKGGELLIQHVPPYVRGEISARAQEPPRQDRRCYPKSVFLLTSTWPANLIRQRVDAVGLFQRFKIEGLDESVGVDRFLCNLGPVTGQPPRERWRSIEMDAADQRVRLRKSTYFLRYLNRLQETRLLARLQRNSRGGI